MDVPTLDLEQQYRDLKDEIDPAIEEIIDNTAFILGKAVEDFESNFASYCDTSQCIGVNSGTSALQLIYDAIGIDDGNEVITSPFTFIATVEPILHLGAKPVFADICPDCYNLDPNKVEDQITENTEAIVAVHLYGHPANMSDLRQIANEHDLWLIEDAAQAHGSRFKNQRVGSIGDAAGFSFYPGKNLGAFGDAGAVTTSRTDLAERIKKLRDHGREGKYTHQALGYNERMDGLQGAVLDVKLDHLDDWNEGRRENAHFYNDELTNLPVETPAVHEWAEHIYHQYVIRTPNRDEVLEQLNDADIGAGIHYPIPLHLQESLSDLDYEQGDFPVAEQAANEVLSLPVFSGLTDDQLNHVVRTLKSHIESTSVSSASA